MKVKKTQRKRQVQKWAQGNLTRMERLRWKGSNRKILAKGKLSHLDCPMQMTNT